MLRPVSRPADKEMAVAYVSEIRTLCASGPYYLAGHSFGGLVAHEMWQQLQDASQVTCLRTSRIQRWRARR